MLLRLLSKLPLGILYIVADVLYLITCYVWRYRKEVIYDNLRNSFPEKGEADIKRLARLFYRNLADIAVETIKAISITPDQLRGRVRIVNPELLDEFVSNQQSVVLMSTHQCNWEWLLLACCVTMPVPIDAVYKPLHNRKMDTLMLETRSRFGANPIPLKDIVLELMKRKHVLKGLAIVADQTPLRDEEKYWTCFLNQDTAFPVGVEKIARITQYPVIFVGMKRVRRGYYEAFLKILAAPPYARDGYPITERYARETERLVQDRPADWLWSYRKWKYRKPLYA